MPGRLRGSPDSARVYRSQEMPASSNDFLGRGYDERADLALCPFEVEKVAMRHRWDQLTFLHWPFDPVAVQALLPPGLTVETYDGQAWVGLVPFVMEVRSAKGRLLPWPSRFSETNVRTYVTGPSGQSGVWFMSLDASRLGVVPAARATYRVRYFWSAMSVSRAGSSMVYSTRRRWPGGRGTSSRVAVEIGDRYRVEELTPFDHYLTAQWVMYGAWGKGLLMAYACHESWVLHRAEAVWDDELVAAAGLPQPTGAPIVHWSPGVDVRIGFPHRTGKTR